MTELYAQPYDISAKGFFFSSLESYNRKAAKLRNSYGQPVEEFEIQFIDGEEIDCALFSALGIHQGNIGPFFAAVETWEDDEKTRIIIAVGECDYSFDLETGSPDEFELDIYELDSLKDLAEQFVDDGLFGDIPDNIRHYLDMDAIARDLGMDYSETTVAGRRIVYR
jgi:hypothetical protein